jgi:hypothetical protein
VQKPAFHRVRIERHIYSVDGQKVMLDSDLATLYGVETKILNRAVTRNRERFPEHFMFQLTGGEAALVTFQNGTSKERSRARMTINILTSRVRSGSAALRPTIDPGRAKAFIRPYQSIRHRVHLIRGQKVMLDADLAILYGVSSRALNQAFKAQIATVPGIVTLARVAALLTRR